MKKSLTDEDIKMIEGKAEMIRETPKYAHEYMVNYGARCAII